MTGLFTAISWTAVIAGFAGTWIAARHPAGWLIGAACSGLWLIYDVDRAIWAGAFAAVVAVAVSIRNYVVTGQAA